MRFARARISAFLFGRRGQSGAVLAEFAIVAPVLVLLLIGIAGLSSYLIQVEKLNSAVEAGILHVTRNGWSRTDANNVSKVQAAVTAAGDSGVGSVGVQCSFGCPTEGGVVPEGTSCNDNSADPGASCSALTPGYTAAPGQYVQITATAPFTNPAAGFAALFGVALPTSISLTATTRAK